MSGSTRMPLHLFQVLEEEFTTLHPEKLGQEQVLLPHPEKPKVFREVTARLDWQFHASHIKDSGAFIAELMGAPSNKVSGAKLSGLSNIPTQDWTKANLTDNLKVRFGKTPSSIETLKAFEKFITTDAARQLAEKSAPARVPDELLEGLAEALNELLSQPDLYDSSRFSSHWLSPASQNLILSLSAGGPFAGEDLAHFNRLLLEDAFPEAFERIHNIRLAAIYKRLHAVNQTALCLSGGGIRSGTFALGLLQGLARHNLIKGFNYLSTVSGGGYIGSWLTAWIHRHPKGLEGVTRELANQNSKSKIDPDSSPIRHLRNYSNFITPQVGLLTADTWTFIGIYFRNLFLNWIVIIPLLMAVLILPRINLATILAQPRNELQSPWVLSIFDTRLNFVGRHIFLGLGFLFGAWALAYVIFNRPSVREELRRRRQFWRARSNQGSVLTYCILPLIGSAFSLTTYWGWTTERSESKPLILFGLFGAVLSAVAWLIACLVLRRLRPANRGDIDKYELLALVIAGFVGGSLLGLVSLVSALGKPIMRVANLPTNAFPWTSWSEESNWTWLTWTTELYACLAVPVFLLTFLLAATFFVGVLSRSPKVDDEDLEWWARLGAWGFIAIIAWGVSNALVIFGPIALLSAPKTLASIGGISGLVAIMLGRSAKTPANEEKATNKGSTKAGVLGTLVGRSLPLLALVFIAAFLAALSLATTGIFQGVALLADQLPTPKLNVLLTTIQQGFPIYINHIYRKINSASVLTDAKIVHMNVLHHSSFWFVAGLGAILFVLGTLISKVINLNLFSLHAGYRNRLIRAFLGASRPEHERRPNPFTGFDPLDNIAMHELRPTLFDEHDFIDPARLVRKLLDPENKLFGYLDANNLLNHVKALANKTTVSPRLIAALRRDLNGTLQDQDLPTHAAKMGFTVGAGAAAESARSTAHILLNRSVLEQVYPNLIRPLSRLETFKLMPVINTTLNLVGGDNLAWQQRKAEPFTITPLHSGCFRVGYRDSREYGGAETGGISIGTAAAISGAAASSNMGYYTTSPILSLLLTFFNVRLGWWLGNPGPAGMFTFKLRAPKYSVRPVIDEALGFTDDKNKYVYLSDGGHFENLALYEMVLRRCHVVVVSDGAQDQDYRFTDLGNAIRKIRIDLGIPIEFWNVPIRSGWLQQEQGMYWAIGRIRYKCIDGDDAPDGLLLYIKPSVYGTEPRDVLEYKKSFPDFPHQTTADQFFDEPQFESYRVLGSHIMDQMCGSGFDSLDIYKMIESAVNKAVESDDTNPRLEKWARAWLASEPKTANGGRDKPEGGGGKG